MKRMVRTGLSLLLLGVASATALAGGLDKFTLSKAIPADSFLAVHTRGHDGQEFLNKQMARIWAEIEKARFDRDIKRFFKTVAKENGQDLEEFEAHWERVVNLATSVDWANLASEEYAMGMRLGFPTPEYLVLMQPPADKVEASFNGLAGILTELVGLDPDTFALTTDGAGSQITHKVSVVPAPFPLGVTLARVDNVILFSFGTGMAEQGLALLAGEEGETLASTERFQGAFAKLPEPQDSAVFFDIAKMLTQIRGMLGVAMQGAPEDQREVPGKLLDRIDIAEYMAAVATTDDKRTTSDSIIVLRENASEKGIYKALMGNGTIAAPLKFVPVDAGNVSVSSGVDLLALYDEVIDILKTDIPEGQDAIDGINGLKEEVGIDIREDIFAWMRGNVVSFSIPGPTAYSPAEFVMMVGVRDSAKGGEMVGKLLDMVAAQFAEQVTIEDASITGGEGFRSIRSPMLGMVGMTAPTIGFTSDWMVVGSSPEIINRAFAVASGDEDNFSKNERFQKEGLALGKNVTSMSFQDTTKFGEELGQALNMVGFMRAMLPPEAAKDQGLQTILGMVSKLGRVARKLDFLLSSATQTTMDGNVVMVKQVSNYREPPEVKKPAPPESD